MSAVIHPFPTKRQHEQVELTKLQLADHWGVSKRQVELWTRDAGLPTLGVFAGKRWFRLADVEEWKRERMEAA